MQISDSVFRFKKVNTVKETSKARETSKGKRASTIKAASTAKNAKAAPLVRTEILHGEPSAKYRFIYRSEGT